MKKLLFIVAIIYGSIIILNCGQEKTNNIPVAVLSDTIFGNDFDLAVDYSKTSAQMIADAKYDHSYFGIEKSYISSIPVGLAGKKVEITARLFHFNQAISREEGIKQLDGFGYRPAGLFELSAFNVLRPDWSQYFLVIALGFNSQTEPHFSSYGSQRYDIAPWKGEWRESARFLAVRK